LSSSLKSGSKNTIIGHNKPVDYFGPRVLVCEGYSDARAIRAILLASELGGFEIGCPSQHNPEVLADGKGGLGKYIAAVYTHRHRHLLSALAVFVDADDNPNSAFAIARDALANAGFQAPSSPYASALTKNDPVALGRSDPG